MENFPFQIVALEERENWHYAVSPCCYTRVLACDEFRYQGNYAELGPCVLAGLPVFVLRQRNRCHFPQLVLMQSKSLI